MPTTAVSRLEPEWSWTKSFGVLPGVRVGNIVSTCGIIPLDSDGILVGRGDIAAQVRKVFANIEEVLALAGCTLSDVVKLTIFMNDLSEFAALKQVRSQLFPNGFPGVVTTVGADLIGDGIKVEMEAVAVIPAKAAVSA